ncbi:hypothetical protein [Sporosarcina sp. BP05]|uniref:hypothetical protein n=1 Tax=Sporosarcina sp. BP05 TaxID=2758726 RepID=UPI0016467014|nr:hypothetical protein [Sporosarcina sp. BP05]
MQRKNFWYLVTAILVIILLIATFFVINNKSNDENSTNPAESNKQNSNNSGEQDGSTSPSDEEESSTLLYGKEDDTVDYTDPTDEESEENSAHFGAVPTIFDETENTKTKLEYKLTKPEILKGSTVPYDFARLILAKDGYVAALVNNKLLYYTPANQQIKQLADNVSNAKASDDGRYVLFEEKGHDKFTTYQYEFPIPKNGKEEVLNTVHSLIDFGVLNHTFYFSSQDDENHSYYYTPFNTSRDDIEDDFFAVMSTYGSAIHRKTVLTYDEEDQTFSSFEGRGKNKQKLFTLPVKQNKHIRQFIVNPFQLEPVILSGFTGHKDFPYGEKVYINEFLIEDIVDLKEAFWINKDILIFTDMGFDQTLNYYDFKTRTQTVLDYSVNSATYDAKNKILYYVKQDNKIRQIKISVD